MNADDPKFTAHVLGEIDDLTPAERAEIEALIASDPTAAEVADETRALAARLRAELPGEAAASLDAEQRAAVLMAAKTEPVPTNKVVRFPRRVTALAALAACVIVGVSYALLFRAYESEHASKSVGAGPEAVVPEVAVTTPQPSEPPPSQPFTLSSTAPEKLSIDEKLAKELADTPRIASAQPAPSVPALQPLVQEPSFAKPTARAAGAASITANNSVTPEFEVRPAVKAMPALPVGASVEYASAGGALVAQSVTAPTVDGRIEKDVAPPQEGMKFKSYDARAISASAPIGGSSRTLTRRSYFRDGNEMPGEDAAYASGVNTSTFDAITENTFFTARENPLSTFSIDVDTASYAVVRRYLNDNQLPPKGAVRVEELLNYFTYNYPQPKDAAPFSATMEVATCPWSPEHRLVRVGLKGREIPKDQRPPSNLVFLIDVSGSMNMPNKLPLIQKCFSLLVDQLGPKDRVSIVTYASGTTLQLEPTQDKEAMQAAIARLRAGGCTYGSSGIEMAYKLAEKSFIPGGTNRVILATDGDWNVGITDERELMQMITQKAKTGVFLTVLGCGMDNLKDSMLVKLADHGNGHYAYIDTELEARKVFDQQLSGTLVTIAKDVKIQVEFNPAQVSSYRLIGYEKRLLKKEDFNDDKKDAGEIGAGHSVTALYEVVPVGKESELAMVDKLKYQPMPRAIPVEKPALRQEPESLQRNKDAPAAPVAEPFPGANAGPASSEEKSDAVVSGPAKEKSSQDKAITIATGEGRAVVKLDKVEADGSITHIIGYADRAEYSADGDVLLYGMPDVTQGTNRCVATSPQTWMKVMRNGRLEAHGSHKTVIVDTDRDDNKERNEMLTLKLRYKEPDGEKSKLLEFPLTDRGTTWEKSTPDFRFAAAVASYGMLLRGSNYTSDATWSSTAKWAREGLGVDENGYRAEFLSLLEKARALKQ